MITIKVGTRLHELHELQTKIIDTVLKHGFNTGEITSAVGTLNQGYLRFSQFWKILRGFLYFGLTNVQNFKLIVLRAE